MAKSKTTVKTVPVKGKRGGGAAEGAARPDKKPPVPERATHTAPARPAKRKPLLIYAPGHGPQEDWNEWRRYI